MINDEVSNLNFCNITVLNQNWQKGNSFSYADKCRPYFGFCCILSGTINYKTEKNEYIAAAGDVVVIKKNAKYTAKFCDDKTHDVLVNFQCDSLDDYFFENITVLKNRVNLKKYFLDILNYYSVTGRQCMVKSMFYQILDEMSGFELADETFKCIKQAIDEDANFSLKQEELARKCSVSVSTLQRIFKRNIGKTVTEYRNELRILKAKQLLCGGGYSMEEIAEHSGFYDSAHFSKFFKKSEGISPKKYLELFYTM